MEQLHMFWKNDGTPVPAYTLPEGYTVKKITEVPDGVQQWLQVISHGLVEGVRDEAFYQRVMVQERGFDPEYCFLVMYGDEAVATLDILLYTWRNDGHLHMVACKENHRGKGLATALNLLALHTVRELGFATASLTTDDQRIPAIKSYYKVGFQPDLSTQDYVERWAKINEKIGR